LKLLSKELSLPILKTERLRLEPISVEHSQGMYELWSDERVTQYSGEVSDYEGNKIEMPAATRDQSDLIIDFWLKAEREGWGFRWAVILEGTRREFTGTIGFNSVSHEYEIAYHLLPKHWGKGVMSEASKAAIDWASSRGADSIVAFVENENKASVALALRIGLGPIDEFDGGAQKYQRMLVR